MAANRANAKKSTGPRTRAGKDRSRLNGLVHGLTASLSLLPGEDPRTFRRLADGVFKEFRPRGQAEVVLVDQYVTIAWKLRRLGAAERAVGADHFVREVGDWFRLRDECAWAKKNPKLFSAEDLAELCEPMGEPPDPATAPELLAQELHEGRGPLLRLMELEMRLRATLANTLKHLKDLRALREAQEEREDELAEPWQAGEWDPDGERLTRRGPKGDDEEEGETEEEGEDVPAAEGQAAAAAAVKPAAPGGAELQTEPTAPQGPWRETGAPQTVRGPGDAPSTGAAGPAADVAPRAPGEPARVNPDADAPDAPPLTPTAGAGEGKSPS